MEIRNILLTTDFSDAAQNAYFSAASIAKKFAARIHIVHAMEFNPAMFLEGQVYGSGLNWDDYRKQNFKHLQTHAGEHPALKGIEVVPHVIDDPRAHEALQKFELEKNIDLVVLSTHGRSGFEYALLGSFAHRLVRSSAAPVLTIRPDDKKTREFSPKRVLVPFDFSENSRAVLPMVRFLSRNYGSTFTFLFAQEPVMFPFGDPMGPGYIDLLKTGVQNVLKEAEERFRAVKTNDLSGIGASFIACEGTPLNQILKNASELNADLILLATHGWTGLRRFLLGSVAEKVVTKAACPVLTVRSPEK
jgi:nucleotide-binding universal stress UspA family protein